MKHKQPPKQQSTLILLCILSGFIWAGLQLGPPYINHAFLLLPTLTWACATLFTIKLTIRLLEHLVKFIDWLSSRTPTGKSGTASWATFKDYRSSIVSHRKSFCFWGLSVCKKNAALIFNFVSNAMCVAPAGSGKGITTVIPNALSIRHSKVIIDFKGELSSMLKRPLQKRKEIVRIINPCKLWEDIIGAKDSLNPLDVITDDLMREGGLRDVFDHLHEMNMQLYPEPAKEDGDNKYFRDGSRDIMEIAEIIECMINGYDATLSAVSLLIKDRQALEDNMRWIAGVNIEGNPHPDGPFPVHLCDWAQNHPAKEIAQFTALLQANANNLIKLIENTEQGAFNSFITGAQQALKPFAFGRLSSAMGRSTFDINELKDRKKTTTLFIVADASRIELSNKFIGLATWHILTVMKRHPNKDVPVYFILDEVTNYFIKGLDSLLTWGRGFGLRLFLIFQTLSAFEQKYGKEALETLLSETEIKLFLPGQRAPKTLTMIKTLLGEQSVMSTGLTRSANQSGLQENQSETPRPLKTEDEIRRMKEGLLLVREHPPIRTQPISYAEIHPWRDQVDINPFYKKRFRKPIKLRF